MPTRRTKKGAKQAAKSKPRPKARSNGKHPGGRPPKIDAEKAETICSYIRIGADISVACAAVGVHRDRFSVWLKRGAEEAERIEKGKKPDPQEATYLKFKADVDQAVAECEVTDLDRIDRAADTIWQAAAWRLERRHPERWALRSKHEHTGKDGKPIEHEHRVPLSVLHDVIQEAEDARRTAEA